MSRLHRLSTAVVLAAVLPLAACGGDSSDSKSSSGADGKKGGSTSSTSSASPSGEEKTPPSEVTKNASNDTLMSKKKTWSGKLTAKSVDASGTGLVAANNMMYTHSITFFDAIKGQRVADVSDEVDLKNFGLSKTSEKLKGAPVEGVWSKDHKYYYVSNYVMDGPGYGDEPNDVCKGTENYKQSFVYRINAETKKIDQVIPVGAVPKYVALTPDGKKLLVSNWCSYTLGVVDLKTHKMTNQIKIGTWPRGIAVSPDSKYAYVAAFGTDKLFRVDLTKNQAEPWVTVGGAARHVTMSPDTKYLYVVASHANTVSKIDRSTGKIVAQTTGLIEPRSLTISPDGKAIYVVNYDAGSVAKIDTATMKRLQVVRTSSQLPIGITYEPMTGEVWVSMYGGTIDVWKDTDKRPANVTGVPTTNP